MPFPWETVPPLAIICGATALMGALPHGIQKLFYGKPKAVLQDSWDRQLGKRDERVLQEWQDKQESKDLETSTLYGSAVKHLAIQVTDAQLQAVLIDYSGLYSLDLTTCYPALSAEGLASLTDFPHILSLDVHATSTSSLELVHTLTHLEELTIEYGILLDEQEAPDFPCRNFTNLTSLKVDTEWREPSNSFLYLSQLQALKHLSLCTAAPKEFNFAAFSLLESLHMDNFELDNLEALQWLPQLMHLDLLGHPSDADVLMFGSVQLLSSKLKAISHV